MNIRSNWKIVLIYLLVISGISCLAGSSFAAVHYINAACTSSCDGATWAKGWETFAAVTWIRGDTYYVAGGTYAENVSVIVASGTDWITIKKANAADNGSDPGWDASFASTVALIQGYMLLGYGHVEVNGVSGSGFSGHGIKVAPTAETSPIILDGSTGPYILRYIEAAGKGFASGSACYSALGNNNATTAQKNLHLAYMYFHDVTCNGLTLLNLVGTSYTDYGLLLENSIIEKTGGCTNVDQHGQGIQFGPGPSIRHEYMIIRNNIFKDIKGSAMIAFLGATQNSEIRIYNNLFYITDLSTYDVLSPGVIYLHENALTTVDKVYVYNNTFYGLGDGGGEGVVGQIVCDSPGATNTEAKNNVWENSYFTRENPGFTSKSNNGFYGNAGIHIPSGETNQQCGASSTLSDGTTYNFNLKASGYAVGKGLDLSGTFLGDFTGTTRTVPWDIGAYGYRPTEDMIPPAAPMGLSVN